MRGSCPLRTMTRERSHNSLDGRWRVSFQPVVDEHEGRLLGLQGMLDDSPHAGPRRFVRLLDLTVGLEGLDRLFVWASAASNALTTVKSAVNASGSRDCSSSDGIRVQALKTCATLCDART